MTHQSWLTAQLAHLQQAAMVSACPGRSMTALTSWTACQTGTPGAVLHGRTCLTCGGPHWQELPACSGACRRPSAWTCCTGLFSRAPPQAGCLQTRNHCEASWQCEWLLILYPHAYSLSQMHVGCSLKCALHPFSFSPCGLRPVSVCSAS